MSNLAEGILKKHYVTEETTYDDYVAEQGADSVGLLELKINPDLKQEEVQEALGTASLQAVIAENRSGKWSAKSTVKPIDGATAPDVGALIKAAMGVETIGAGVEYTLSDTVRNSLKISEHIPGSFFQAATGAFVEQMEIDATGNTKPTISFSGGYASHLWAYGSLVAAAGAGIGDADVPINSLQRGNLSVDAIVDVGTNTERRITAVDWDNDTITVSPVLADAVVEGAAVIPHAPATAVSGSILGGVAHELTIDGIVYGFISAKIALSTGLHGLDKEASSDRPTRIGGGARRVTGKLQVYFLDQSHGQLFGRAWDAIDRALILRLGGDVSNKRFIITIPKARLMVSPIDVPDADEATAEISFTAMQDAAPCDEMKITID